MRASARGLIVPYEKKDIGPEDYAKKGHSLPVRSGAQQVSERRPRTASAEHDRDAQPAPRSGGRGRHRDLSDDAEEAGAIVLCGCCVHGRSGTEGGRQEVGPALRLLGMPRDLRLRRRRPHRHRVDVRRQQADRATRLRALHRSLAARRQRCRADQGQRRSGALARWSGQQNPGTTTKDSSSTNWPSPTFTTRAR